MKILILVATAVIILFTFKSIAKPNDDHYTIIKKIENIEIREYKQLIYVSYTPENIKDRDNSFRNVASYIFGGNEKKEKIEMTSPVVIKLHNQNEMAFIMPKKYNLNNLPKADNNKLLIYQESKNIKASIFYSGYSNDEKEEKNIKLLKKKLKKHNIKHRDDFELLVYNSPYQFFNRRNEIVVSVDYSVNDLETMENKNLKKIYFGSGCFWCTEAIFEDIYGVENVTSGFSGGNIRNPSYKEVSRGLTNHAEVCEIIYNDKKILLENLLEIFFLTHDPTSLNRQGNDIGRHYRSIILYVSESEKIIIDSFLNQINKKLYNNEIVTEVKEFNAFYKAEEYHQNYYKENYSEPYCNAVISPKIKKARKKLSKYYK